MEAEADARDQRLENILKLLRGASDPTAGGSGDKCHAAAIFEDQASRERERDRTT